MLLNLWNKSQRFLLPFLFIIGISLRLYLSTLPAQYYDMGTYQAWGQIMLAKGPHNFFNSTWSDYLPLPIYFCSAMVLLADYFKASYGLVFKLSVSAIELILLTFIWKSTKAKTKYLLIPLFLLSPALLGDSSWWGQLDTIPTLLALLSLVLLKRSSSHHSLFIILTSFLFGLAVAFKPIMLLVLPVILLVLYKKFSPLFIIQYSLFSFVIFLLPALPLGGNPLSFVVNKSIEQSSTYPYTTINGWNFWSIIPLHNSWPPDSESVLSISAHNFGLFVFAALTLFSLNEWRKRKFAAKYAYRVAAALLINFYVFTTRMHERHLLFGLPFLTLATLSDSWLIIPLLLITFNFTTNLWSAYYWVNHSQTWPVTEVVIQFISYLNVAAALFFTFVWDIKNFFAKVLQWLQVNRLFFLIILLAGFLRLYQLGYPSSYIFDEVYHSFTAREFIHNHVAAWEWWTTPPPGVAYEWTHPPLAKYGMVASMLIFGENSFGWRFGSAVMGVLSIIGLYYLVLAVFQKKNLALLAAFLVTIEGLHLSQSRVGMNDMYMLNFFIWSLYCAVKNKWKLAAVLYGLSLSSKWSAMYGIVPLAVIYLHSHKFDIHSLIHNSLFIIRLLLIAVLVYLLTFIPFLTAGHSWGELWELHRQMWYYHTHLVATHTYQSTPLQWLFVLRPVWYYVQYGAKVSNIYAQGNPAVLWLGLAAFLLLLPRLLRFRYSLFIILYSIFTLPWFFSPRIMFFYHYLPSAGFLCVLLAAWLFELPRRTRLLAITFCVLTFILLSPVYYGFPMPPAYWNTLFGLFPSWK